MDDKRLSEFICFDQVASIYNKTRAVAPDAVTVFADMVLHHTVNKNNPILLDIGVGTGRISRAFPKTGVQVIGVDISEKMLHAGRKQENSSQDLILADARSIPLRNKSCDTALLIQVLHLVRDWKQVLQEALRILKDEGVFAIGAIYNKPIEEDLLSPYYDFINKKRGTTARIGPKDRQEITDFLHHRNLELFSTKRKSFPHTKELKEILSNIARRSYSSQWKISVKIHEEAMQQLYNKLDFRTGLIPMQSIVEANFFRK